MCVPMPDGLSYEEGAAIACGTGTAYQALRRLDVSGRDALAVFGQGPVGLSGTFLGAHMGARVIAVDPVAERRALAEASGAWHTIDPMRDDPVSAIYELTGGRGADATLDATGIDAVRAQRHTQYAHMGPGLPGGRGRDAERGAVAGHHSSAAQPVRLLDIRQDHSGGAGELGCGARYTAEGHHHASVFAGQGERGVCAVQRHYHGQGGVQLGLMMRLRRKGYWPRCGKALCVARCAALVNG